MTALCDGEGRGLDFVLLPVDFSRCGALARGTTRFSQRRRNRHLRAERGRGILADGELRHDLAFTLDIRFVLFQVERHLYILFHNSVFLILQH